MKLSKEVVLGSVIGLSLVLSGCDQSEKEPANTPQNENMTAAGQYDLVTPEGRLPDSLSKDLIRVQRNLTGVANLLGQLEGSFPARKTAPPRKLKEGATVAEIILADDGDDEEGDE